jgi:hypothetical protein
MTMHSSYELQDIGTMHYVHLGAPAGGGIDQEYEKAAMAECSALFPSFSVSRATGIFRGNREEVLIFQIATADTARIMDLAARLRERFDQDGVGVVRPTPQGGFYSRVIRAT